MQSTQIQKISEFIEPLLEGKDLFVVDIEVKGTDLPEIWVYLDKEASDIMIEECTAISRELGQLIEESDLFNKKYRLNVSSPGMSRPLTDRRQFSKHVGRSAKVKFREIDNPEIRETVIGKIRAFDENAVLITVDKKTERRIEFDQFIEFKIQPSF